METSRKVGQQEVPQPQQGGNGSTLRPVVAALVGAGLLTPIAYAAPEGGTVVGGAAEIRTISATRTDVVQHTPRAIVDWRSFSIAPREHVNFQQPSTSASILNRVTGPQASELHGRLTANGNVYLVNPNGVVFGQNARIDVGSLIASTANITNENFMAGRLRFDQPGNQNARILNSGQITVAEGGLAAFVAPSVENSGLITARLGKIMLAAGEAFTLDLYGDGMVSLLIDKEVAERITDAEGRPLANLINTGTIDAAGGTILLTTSAAKTAVDEVINVGGVVRARSVAEHNGEIVLTGGNGGKVVVSGVVDASGRGGAERGGTVKLFGEDVALSGSARLDVSGVTGGGTALVGGDYQGRAGTPRASITSVAAAAQIDASATGAGDGGLVVVWADRAASYAGNIRARGGSSGGDGGLVEVSGKHTLNYTGKVDASASVGYSGTLLLDPVVQIVDQGLAKSLSDQLAGGTNVWIQADELIQIDASIDGRRQTGGVSGASFTADSAKTLAVNANVLTADGAITLKAGSGGIAMKEGTLLYAGSKEIALGTTNTGAMVLQDLVTTGTVTLTSGGTINLNRALAGLESSGRAQGIGKLVVDAKDTTTLNDVYAINGIRIETTEGNVVLGSALTEGAPVHLNANGGDVTLNGVVSTAGSAGDRTGGTVELSAANALTIAASGGVLTGDARVSGSAGTGGIRMLAAGNQPNDRAAAIQAGKGDVQLTTTNGGSIELQDLVSTGTITLNSGGTITLNRPLAGFSDVAGKGQGIGKLVVIDAKGMTTLNDVYAREGVEIETSSGDILVRNALTEGKVAKFNAKGGALTIDGIVSTAGAREDQNGGEVTLAAADSLTIGASGGVLTRDAAVTATARGTGGFQMKEAGGRAAIIQSGTGNVMVTAENGGIELQDLASTGAITLNSRGKITQNRALSGLKDENGNGQGIGSLIITDASGTTALKDIYALRRVEVDTTAGDVTIEGLIQANDGPVRISPKNGSVIIVDAPSAMGNQLARGIATSRGAVTVTSPTDITIGAGGGILTTAGNIELTAGGSKGIEMKGGAGDVPPALLQSGSGEVKLTTQSGGSIILQEVITDGTLRLKSGGGITANRNLIGTDVNGVGQGIGKLVIEDARADVQLTNIFAKDGIDVTTSTGNTRLASGVTNGAPISVKARDGSVTLNGQLRTTGLDNSIQKTGDTLTVDASAKVTAGSAGGAQTFDGLITIKGGTVSVDANASIQNLSTNTSGSIGGILIEQGSSATGDMTLGTVYSAGPVTLRANGGGIQAKRDIASGSLDVDAAGAVQMVGIRANGHVNVTSKSGPLDLYGITVTKAGERVDLKAGETAGEKQEITLRGDIVFDLVGDATGIEVVAQSPLVLTPTRTIGTGDSRLRAAVINAGTAGSISLQQVRADPVPGNDSYPAYPVRLGLIGGNVDYDFKSLGVGITVALTVPAADGEPGPIPQDPGPGQAVLVSQSPFGPTSFPGVNGRESGTFVAGVSGIQSEIGRGTSGISASVVPGGSALPGFPEVVTTTAATGTRTTFDFGSLAGASRAAQADAKGVDERIESESYEVQYFYSGRGVGQAADLGLGSATVGVPFDVFGPIHQPVLPGAGTEGAVEGGEYFETDSFGRKRNRQQSSESISSSPAGRPEGR